MEPLGETSILEITNLKNANGGDARTLEDVGFLSCIDVFTYWFYEKDRLRDVLDKPILPWKVCDLNEGFQQRIQNGFGWEAEKHFEKLAKEIGEDNDDSHFEPFNLIFQSCSIDQITISLVGFPSVLGLYTFWNYEKNRLVEMMNEKELSKDELFNCFEKFKLENSDIAWRSLDFLLRKRTTFLSHILIQ